MSDLETPLYREEPTSLLRHSMSRRNLRPTKGILRQHLWLLIRQKITLKLRDKCSTIFEILLPVVIAFAFVLIAKAIKPVVIEADNYDTIVDKSAMGMNYTQASYSVAWEFKPTAGIFWTSKNPVLSSTFPVELCVAERKKVAFAAGSSDIDWEKFKKYLTVVEPLFAQACTSNNSYFSNEDDAVDYAKNDGAGKLIAVVILNDISLQKPRYTIRLNRSDAPDTTQASDRWTLGRGSSFQQYIRNGFLGIQNLINGYLACLIHSGNKVDTCTTDWYNKFQTKVAAYSLPLPIIKVNQNQFFAAAKAFCGLVFVLAFVYPMCRVVKLIVEEKESRIKEGMLMMGLHPTSYFLSWLTLVGSQFTIESFAVSLVCAVVFSHSDWFLMFVITYLFNMASMGLCFLLGAIFSKARTSALFAVLILIVTALPVLVLPEDIAASTKGILCLLPAIAYSYSLGNICLYESVNIGMKWGDIGDTDWPVRNSIIILIFDIFLYQVLAWYVGNVFPGEYGVPQKPWFLFTKEYWFPLSPEENIPLLKEKRDSHFSLNSNEEYIELPPPQMVSSLKVSINKLRKTFGKFVAVDRLSLDMYEGQIMVLLGHNGAGKTTCINMMTGMLPSTSGDCTIYGNSITNNMPAIRRDLGVCPQHNILWPNYSVEEHLTFYARLKGTREEDVPAAVREMIDAINLPDKTRTYSSALSGGMKRRLSVGIALIGGSRMVFLDEPTAGMDPEAREQTHRLLASNTAGRVIVLTTHFMDEADKLGDRIAIMSKGKLRCCGSPLFLKSRLGVGYNLTVSTNQGSNHTSIIQLVSKYVPQSKVQNSTGMELTILLPMDSLSNFSKLFRELENNSKELQIDAFGISMTKLEDVFMKIAIESEDQEEEEEGPDEEETSSPTRAVLDQKLDSFPLYKGFGLFCYQFFALMVKRFHCSRRDRGFVVCLTVLPVLVVIGALLLTLITVAPTARDLSINNLTGPMEFPLVNKTNEYFPLPKLNYISLPNSSNSLNATNYLFNTYNDHTLKRQGGFVLGDTLASICCFDPNTGAYSANGSPLPLYGNTILHNSTEIHALPTFYNEYMKGAFASLGYGDVDIGVTSKPLPLSSDDQKIVNTYKLVGAAIIILFPFTFIPANFASFLVKERSCKAKHVQLVSGVNVLAYWLASYVWDLLLYSITVLLTLLVFALFKKKEYIGDGEKLAGTWLLFTLYGTGSTALAYLCSFLFKNHSTAQVLLMMVNLIFGVFLVIAARIMGLIDSTKSVNEKLMHIYRLVPAYCLGEGLINLSISSDTYKLSGATPPGTFSSDVIGRVLIYLAIETPIFFIGTLLVEWDGWRPLWNRFFGKELDQYYYDQRVQEIDEDVDREAKEIAVGNGREGDLVTVQNLWKVYPPAGNSAAKLAVRGLSFGVHSNEIFALLGTNGAGKTTTLSILSGEFPLTSGHCFLGGWDVSQNLKQARRGLGYCPQFDALLELMSVEEHLIMYARLRGIPGTYIPNLVNQTMKHLGLTQYRRKQSKKLSGGNKRKLSVGLCIIGGPRVVLFDEPSAGMDPVARHSMCEAILGVAQGRSIILTTHHLEEVEALANRVGIMVKGQFRCLGTIQHLKSKFGQGYWLEFRVKEEKQKNGVIDFVSNVFGQSSVEENQGTFIRIKVITSNLKLSSVFEDIEKRRSELGIQDYSVSQPTLEQVFLHISELDEDGHDDQ